MSNSKPLTEGKIQKGGRDDPPESARPGVRPQGELLPVRERLRCTNCEAYDPDAMCSDARADIEELLAERKELVKDRDYWREQTREMRFHQSEAEQAKAAYAEQHEELLKMEARAEAAETENAALKKQVEELKDFRNTRDLVAELIKTSTQTGANIRGLFSDITMFKKDQKELAELQNQQEADTSTIGVLADVVDVLWEDDRRCLNHGYGDVVAKAKEVVARVRRGDIGSKVLRYVLFVLTGSNDIKADLCDDVQMAADRTKARIVEMRELCDKPPDSGLALNGKSVRKGMVMEKGKFRAILNRKELS